VKAKLAEVGKAAEVHGASVAELTGQNEKIAADKSALQQQADQARSAAEQMRSELADLRARVSAGNRALEQQVSSVNEAAAAGEKLQLQVKDLTAQLAALRTENSRLGSVGETAGTLRAELAEVKTKLADAQKAAEQQGSAVAELTGANEKFSGNLKEMEAQLAALRADNVRLAKASEQGKQDAEQRAAGVSAAAAAQLAAAQRDLAATRAESARLSDSLQAVERDRVSRLAQLQQENAAITARLRQAQGTLDQIASAARLINGGSGLTTSPLVPATPTVAPQAGPVAAPQLRTHVVQEGDSLTRISSRYYGTTARWQEIYEANREVLKGENALRPGQRLKIP
jgi:nucleoid-associated protein YgaU